MTSSSSLYQKIEAELRDRIANGHYRSGDLLPSEVALCEAFGVSRITIRRALEGLADSRLVIRQRGRGTVVADPTTLGSTLKLTGYIDDAIPWNRYSLLSDQTGPPPEPIAALLDATAIAPQPVRRIVAVNQPGGEPLSVAEFYFPQRYAAQVDPSDFFGSTPLIRLLAQRTGLALAHAEQVVEAVLPDEAVAGHLGIQLGTPILRTTRGFFAEGGIALQVVRTFHHPVRYRFVATLLPKVQPLPARRR